MMRARGTLRKLGIRPRDPLAKLAFGDAAQTALSPRPSRPKNSRNPPAEEDAPLRSYALQVEAIGELLEGDVEARRFIPVCFTSRPPHDACARARDGL